MSTNTMPPRIKSVAPNVDVEQIATNVTMTYDPVTQQGLAVFNFRGVLIANGSALDFSGAERAQVVTSTENHGQRLFAEGIVDPVTGADLSQVSAAGILIYLKSMAAQVYDETLAAVEATVPASEDKVGALPTPLE